jgi:23S rRNA (cytosine1962-C5)-methyltransferase
MKLRLTLKPGREKSLLRRHPWIFSGALAGVEGEPAPGEMVPVVSAQGAFLAWAAYNPHSQIVGRVWSWDQQRAPDRALLRERLSSAIETRQALLPDVRAARLVHAESDRLPGVVVDRYDDVHLAARSVLAHEPPIVALIEVEAGLVAARDAHLEAQAVLLHRDRLGRRGAAQRADPRRQSLQLQDVGIGALEHAGEAGQLHQHVGDDLSQAIGPRAAELEHLLDCFCYTGGFALNALAGGARSVLAVDSSADALQAAQRNAQANEVAPQRVQWLEGDVFQALRRLRDQARAFDLIVLDPPKFAPTAALAERAARAYKDINLLAFKLLRPGGLLFTFSCSGGMPRELFQKVVAGAALDAGVHAQIVRHLDAAPDHPVALAFPEGEYLKGLLCRVA